ncbi:MAG: hypothetical protein IK083_02690, partial [Abditibacteriota bacterium]|nr:hypothetical protein [Abditibacteriota bacterium]
MKFILISLLMTLVMAAAAVAAEETDPGAFEKDWSFVFMNKSAGAGSVENEALSLNYDFSRGDYSSHVSMSCPLPLDSVPVAFRFKVRKTAPHTMAFRLSDSEDETFQKKMNIPVCSDWQEVEVSVDGFEASWGEKKNDVFDGKPSGVGFAVEQGLTDETRGRLEIRDLRCIYGRKNGGKLSLDSEPFGNTVKARFYADIITDNQPVREGGSVAYRQDMDLRGTVESISVPVTKKGSVTVRTACQFDFFEMTKEADGPGAVVFPCGKKMEGWTVNALSFAGELYAPLRLMEIVYHDTEPDGAPVCETVIQSSERITAAPEWEAKDGKAVFTVKARCLSDEPVKTDLFLDVRDYNGALVRAIKKKVALSGMGREDVFTFEVPFGKEPFLEASVRFGSVPAIGYAAPALTDSDRCSTVALDMRESAYGSVRSAELDQTPFGMGVYLYRRQGEWIGKTAQLAGDIGVKWTREEFNWGAIEQEKGVLNYAHYDQLVDEALKNGISIYGLLAYWNHNYPQDTDEGRAAYYNFVRETVLRYKDRIRHWEIWNEPNIGFFPGDKENYFLMLRDCYKLIKDIDPSLQVLGCSTSLIDTEFIERAINAGCNFDVLTVHPYRARLDDEGFIRELQDAIELTKKIDGVPRDVWITEMGWPTHVYTGYTEREQAWFLVRTYADAASVKGVSSISWYDFINDGRNRFYNEHSFGLLWQDLRPKPSYIAFDTFLAMAKDAEPARKELGKDVFAVGFEKDGYKAAVLWSREDGLYSWEGDAVFYDQLGRRIEGKGLVWLAARKPVFAVGGLEGLTKEPLVTDACSQ